jgi:hypothetical protein
MLQISQAPFSDAYLTTQPSKRRRLIAAEKPEGSVERVIAETLQVKGILRGRVGGRVAREVCEKVAKNVAQRFFWSKLINKLYRGKKWPKYLGFVVYILTELPKRNYRPKGKNASNLVTLLQLHSLFIALPKSIKDRWI